jgi:hypothetical protein
MHWTSYKTGIWESRLGSAPAFQHATNAWLMMLRRMVRLKWWNGLASLLHTEIIIIKLYSSRFTAEQRPSNNAQRFVRIWASNVEGLCVVHGLEAVAYFRRCDPWKPSRSMINKWTSGVVLDRGNGKNGTSARSNYQAGIHRQLATNCCQCALVGSDRIIWRRSNSARTVQCGHLKWFHK